MKKLLFLLSITCMLTNSCSPYIVSSSTLRYNAYGNFYISESNSTSFDFRPIGHVRAMVESGYNKGIYVSATEKNALDALHKEALKNGAEGIINLKFEYILYTQKSGNIKISAVIATGMAIK